MRRPLIFAALMLAACGNDDGTKVEHNPNKWVQTFDSLPGALISVSGTAHDDV